MCDFTSAIIPIDTPEPTIEPSEPDASVGSSILRAWAGARLERYVIASRAARRYVEQLVSIIPPPEAEEFFFARVVLPALRRLLSDGDVKEAHRLVEYIEGLCLSGDFKRLNETVTGQAHLAELRAGLASYITATAAETQNAFQDNQYVTNPN